MSKIIYKVVSAFVMLVLVFGNANNTGASSTHNSPISQSQTTALPAFPEAEGFGANTIGGRGGVIFEVTNLNDSGVGSLRACVIASGPRTCVFRTGGLIVLQSALRIVNPYITIAGQTAPGGGITLKKASGGDVFSTQTHDVIIRYLTSRPGPGGENHANQIAKNGTELYNIIIDHNSLSWGVDSNIETWYRVREATIQWSLISEALNNSTHSKGAHSKGLMIGGYQGSESGGKGSENISVLNNLMAHNAERDPLMVLCGTAQVINNTTYNSLWTFAHQQLNCTLGESYVNWINNYHKKGPSSTSNTDLKIIPADNGTWSPGKVYVKGNIGPNRPNDSLPETNWVSGAPSGVIVTSPAPAPAVYSTNAMDAYNSVIAEGGVGNSRGLSCDGSWVNRRDSIDARVINEVITGTGKIIDDPSQVGSWIAPAVGVPCADGDHDGMPDIWEQMYGLNPNIANSAGDKDGDGYTNVEEYFNVTNPVDTPPTTIYPTVTGSTPTSSAAGIVNFTVTFSKNVTGVDVSDFRLTTSGVSGAAVNGVSGSGSTYTVAVSTGSGAGMIRLDVVDDNSIVDAASNPLGGAAVGDGDFTTGEVYTINKKLTFKSVGANDGWVLESGENSNMGGTKNNTAATFTLGDNVAKKQYLGILHFNTAGLPDNAVITNATLKIKKSGGSGNTSTLGILLADMTKPSFGTAALAISDFQAVAGKPDVFTPFVISGSWHSATLKSAGFAYVNRLGATQLRLRFTKDDDNDRFADFLTFYSGDAADANRPQLIIQYFVP